MGSVFNRWSHGIKGYCSAKNCFISILTLQGPWAHSLSLSFLTLSSLLSKLEEKSPCGDRKLGYVYSLHLQLWSNSGVSPSQPQDQDLLENKLSHLVILWEFYFWSNAKWSFFETLLEIIFWSLLTSNCSVN